MQEGLKGTQLAATLREDLLHFIGEMNYPEDLLRYAAEYLEPMTLTESAAEDSADMLDGRTELGRYIRQVCLAIRAIPFEVRTRPRTDRERNILACVCFAPPNAQMQLR